MSHAKQGALETARFEDNCGTLCEQPKSNALGDEEKEDYLKWLSVLVERINASLVPDHPGKTLISVL